MNTTYTNIPVERLTAPYVVSHNSGDFIDYACEWCARQFAEEHGLEWHHSYTEEHESGYHAYEQVFSEGETDYPVACYCGQYLRVSLTPEGEDYMRENDFPAWLYEAHGVER